MHKIKIFIFTTCFILSLNSQLMAQGDSAPDDIIARAGEATLTTSHFSMMLDLMPPQIQVMMSSNEDMRRELITRWVEINLIAQEALAQGLDKEPAVAHKLEAMRNRILVEALLAKRITFQEQIPQDEIDDYYVKNANEFESGEQIQAQHILIRVDSNAPEEEQNKAKKTIDTILKKLKSGESFSDLAQQYSQDPGSKENGGNLGYFGRGQLVKEFEDAAFTLEPGKISKPIHTRFGWHLIRVNNRKAPHKLSLEKVSRKIESKLKSERSERALQNLLKDLKAKYPVMIQEQTP